MSTSSGDVTNSTEELDGKYDSEHDSYVDMQMEDDVDPPDGIDLDGGVDMMWDGDNKDEEDEEEGDQKEEEEE